MGTTFQIAPGEEAFVSGHGLTGLEAVFRLESGRRLDKSGLESWRQRWCLELAGTPVGLRRVYLKRFDHPPFRRQWERWREGRGRLSTAGVEWNNARLLAAAGIPAVRALSYGQDMIGPWERRSFVLLAEVPGEALERWLPVHVAARGLDSPGSVDPDRRRRLLEAAARLVAEFHAAGFVHRDLYLSHLFFDGETLRLIDLQRVFRPRWRKRRWVIKDLAALHYSTPADRIGFRERLRFLCRYAKICTRFGEARILARLIDRKTRRMARRRPDLAVGLNPELASRRTK